MPMLNNGSEERNSIFVSLFGASGLLSAFFYFLGRYYLDTKLALLGLPASSLNMSFPEFVIIAIQGLYVSVFADRYFYVTILIVTVPIFYLTQHYGWLMLKKFLISSITGLALVAFLVVVNNTIADEYKSKIKDMDACIANNRCETGLHTHTIIYGKTDNILKTTGIIVFNTPSELVVYQLQKTLVIQKSTLVSISSVTRI